MQTIPQVSMAIQDKRPSSSPAAWFVDSEGVGEELDARQLGLNFHFVCFHDFGTGNVTTVHGTAAAYSPEILVETQEYI